jgi:hypothetical protein
VGYQFLIYKSLVDGRPELVEEIRGSIKNLGVYLIKKVTTLLKDPKFIDSLPVHLPPDMASQERLPLLLERLRKITKAAT